MTSQVVVSASKDEPRLLNGQGERRSVFRLPQVTAWHSACGDFICCPRYHFSAPLFGQRRFEATHDRALGPTGLQDVAGSLHLSLPVTHRDCTAISHQDIMNLGAHQLTDSAPICVST